MGWAKRESVNEDLVILGDKPENKKKAGGLLAAVKKDKRYDNNIYVLVQKDGTEIELAGSASINRMIGEEDIGKFVKAEFFGWGNSLNGKFKQIEVQVWEGDITDDMKSWPRWAELQNGGKPKPAATKAAEGFDDFRQEVEDEDEALPF